MFLSFEYSFSIFIINPQTPMRTNSIKDQLAYLELFQLVRDYSIPNYCQKQRTMSDCISLWDEQEVQGGGTIPLQPLGSGSQTSDTRADVLDYALEERISKTTALVEEMITQAQKGMDSVVDISTLPDKLREEITDLTGGYSDTIKSIGDASTERAVQEWGNVLVDPLSILKGAVTHPRVISVPEWIAILNLMAIQDNTLDRLARELEYLGNGFVPQGKDTEMMEKVSKWISANVGPVTVQIFTTRVSSLKSRLSYETRVRGGGTRQIWKGFPVSYFRSSVQSVKKDDLEDVILQILSSAEETDRYSSMLIGRGRNPYHIPKMGGLWSKICNATNNLRITSKPWEG